MKLEQYTVEYQVGNVKMISSNVLVEDTTDMLTVEFWEERLKLLKQPFAVVYRNVKGQMLYSIFTELKKKNSSFR